MKSYKVCFFILLIFIFYSCSIKEVNVDQLSVNFDIEGKSYFTLINNSNHSIELNIRNISSVPVYHDQKIDTIVNDNDSIKIELITQGSSYYYLEIDSIVYRVFSSVNGQVKMLLDKNLLFTGSYASINNLLLKKSGSYYSVNTDWIPYTNLTQKEEYNYDDLMRMFDNITKDYIKYLDSNVAIVPKWYIDFERKRIQYISAYFKLNSLSYRKKILGFNDSIPKGYVKEIVEGLTIEDKELLGSMYYHYFLHDFVIHSFKSHHNKENENYYDQLFKYGSTKLSPPFNDYFLTEILRHHIKNDRSNFNKSWLSYLQDNTMKEFLNQQLMAQQLLPTGVDLPNFSVLTIDSLPFNSDQLKDSLILINFWATYCNPCIKLFPEENELVEYFKNKPVKIVNICLGVDFNVFKNLVKKHNLKTHNLYAAEMMTEKINIQFDIDGVPHRVIVDENGKIIENNYSILTKNITSQIDSLLTESK